MEPGVGCNLDDHTGARVLRSGDKESRDGAAAEWRQFGHLPVASAFGYASSVLALYSIGPYIAPLQQEFGWSRAQISFGLTIAAALSGLFCVPVGMLVDRIGPRPVGLFGVPLMSAAVALLGTATGKPGNWILLWSLVAIGTLFVQATIWTTAVNSRFASSRGLALAVTLSGASIAASVFPILSAGLIDRVGWRAAFTSLGGIWVTTVFPLLFFLFRSETKGHVGARRRSTLDERPTTLEGMTLREGLRTPALYKLVVASSCFTFTAVGAVVHFVPILRDSGAPPMEAAALAGLVGIFSIVGRLGTGALLDRYPAHLVGAAAFLLPILGATLLLADGTRFTSQALAAVAYGLTLGAEVDVIAYLTARHFGLRHFGALYGLLLTALSVGTATGPLVAGAVFDHYGSYAIFLILSAALLAISSIALASLGRPQAALSTVAEPA